MDTITFVEILAGISVIQFIASKWIIARINESIRHEYEKKLEEYKFEIVQREQASKISELFAMWFKYGGREDELLDVDSKRNHFEKLNKLTCELAIWVKNENLVKEIMSRLHNDKDALHYKEIIIKMREYILGDKCKELRADNLIHFV
jgi:hypothetical protein